MTAQELRTRELLTRALPYLGPEGVEAVSAYLVGDRSFVFGTTSWTPNDFVARHTRTLLHWACNRPGSDWEASAQNLLIHYFDRCHPHDSPPTTTP